MKKKGSISITLELLIGIIIGIAILFILLYPLEAIASLLFGRSQPCLDENSKSSVNIIANELEFLKDYQESSQLVYFQKKNCALVVFDSEHTSSVPIPEALEGSFTKSRICICQFSDGACTDNIYCRDLENIKSIDFSAFGQTYILSDTDLFSKDIFYQKQGDKLVFYKDSVIETSTEPLEGTDQFKSISDVKYQLHSQPTIKFDNYPVDDSTISSCYGPRMINGAPDWHDGVDFSVPEGTPVKAVMAGIIQPVQTCQISATEKTCHGYGNTIVIKHNDALYTRYSHLSKISVFNNVEAGKEIGLSGNTGFSTGPHLDFKVYFSEADLNKKDPDDLYYDRDPLNYLPISNTYNFNGAASCRTSPTLLALSKEGSSMNGITLAA